jgi:hypothetical protein
LLSTEAERQPGNDKGRKKDGQKPLPGTSEGDYFALSGTEGLSSARVSAITDLQGVTSRFDWYLDRVVHFNRPDRLIVDQDAVRATTDFRSDCFVGDLQRCRHLESPLSVDPFACSVVTATFSTNSGHGLAYWGYPVGRRQPV